MGDRTVAFEGVELPLRDNGNGPPVLFLHGWAGRDEVGPFEKLLTERYRVVVPEHPGFGTTERVPWIENMHDLALFYRELSRELFGDEPFVLMGHSLGGWAAAEFAVHFSDLLRALVLITPMGVRRSDAPMVDIFLLQGTQQLSDLAWHDPAKAPPLDDPTALEVIRTNAMSAQLAWNPRLHDPRLEERLRWITAPTIVVWGDGDKLLDKRTGRVFTDVISDAHMVRVEDASHFPHLENPDQCADLVLGALASVMTADQPAS